MTNPMNIRVSSKSEYDRWLAYLRAQGFTVTEIHKGGMMNTVEIAVKNPDGDLNPSFGASSFVDAQSGRRVYMIQIRAVVPTNMDALLAAARSTPIAA